MPNANPVRGRLNAWLLSQAERYMHEQYGAIKSRLLADVPATVVELGPGAGAHLRYLPRGTRLIAIEPNPYVHDVLRRRAAQRGIELDLRGLAGEALDLEENSVDFVFGSLVLCTVANPQQVLREVRRVLRPQGRFVCVEHVAAPQGSGAATAQRWLRRPWKWLLEGCDLCRDTASTLRAAGFTSTAIEPFVPDGGLAIVRNHIVATCAR
jgi:SAM-dependent methyltransferase